MILLAQEEEEKRLKLYNEGLSDGKIAAKLNLGKTTIREWRKRRKLSPNISPFGKIDEAKLKKIREYHSQGLSDVKIGEILNVHQSTVRLHRKKLGLPSNYYYNKKLFFEINSREIEIINLYHENKDLTWQDIADKTRTTTEKVRLIIGKHLMRICRSQESCPFSALLPEYEEEGKI